MILTKNQNTVNNLELFKKVNPMDWNFINTEEFLCFDEELDFDTKQFLGNMYDFYHIEPIHVHPRLSDFCNLLTQNNWTSSHIIYFHRGCKCNVNFVDDTSKYIYIFNDKDVHITIENNTYDIKPNIVCRLLNKDFSLESISGKAWNTILVHSNLDLC